MKIIGSAINMNWHDPINIVDINYDRKNDTIKEIPSSAGIYVFYRQHGSKQEALYIGKSTNLKKRIDQEMNAKELVEHIKESKSGAKYLIYSIIEMHGNCNIDKYLDMVETEMILSASDLGHDIFNKKKKEIKAYEVINIGNNMPSFFTKKMHIQKI